MRATFQKCALIFALVLPTFTSFGQTNVYSLSVHTRWTIGSHPVQFGLEGYWKDAAGYYILAADGRSVGGQMTGAPKDYTAVILGPVAFSVPCSPLPVAIFGVLTGSAFCLLAFGIIRRLRRSGQETRTEP